MVKINKEEFNFYKKNGWIIIKNFFDKNYIINFGINDTN